MFASALLERAGMPRMLIDISNSTSTNAMNKRLASKGKRLKGSWIVDADGNATDDPRVLFEERAGAMLPLRGLSWATKDSRSRSSSKR